MLVGRTPHLGTPTAAAAGNALGRNGRKKLVMRGLLVRRTPADFFVLSNPVRFLNASLGNYTLEDCT